MTSGIGFYLEDLNSWVNTPAGSTIMGNGSSADFQQPINNAGRTFGFSASLNANSTDLWSMVSAAVNSDEQSRQKAASVLQAAFTYGPSVLAGRGSGGNWFYSQNFQINSGDGTLTDANPIYAGVAAILWSFRQLYPDIAIVPVFDSYYLKSLGQFDIKSVNSLLGPLALTAIPTDPAPGVNWNFISTLYYNHLLDGFIGDNYTPGDEGFIPVDALPFYDQSPAIPYALQSSYSVLANEVGKPIKTSYQGDLPVTGSIWFGDGPAAPFDPSSDLLPEETPLGQLGRISGTSANDIIVGTSANELIVTLGGHDQVMAGNGNDEVRGQAGDDSVWGQRGNDVLNGGKGKNRCWGGSGQDSFVVSRGGFMKVMDWQQHDRVLVEEGINYELARRGGNAYITTGDGEELAIIKNAKGTVDIVGLVPVGLP